MPSRPESRPASAILSPSPSSPSSRSAGTRTSSNRIVAVAEPVSPIFRSGGSALSPSVSAGTRKQEMPFALVRGARHHLVEVGMAAVRGPGLRAVDDVVVAVAPGAGPHRRRVGAGVRLGEAVGAEQLAGRACRAATPARCSSVPAGRQAEAGQRVHRDPDADARPDGRDLLDHLEVDLVGLAAAAVLLGVGQAEQPGAAQRAEHLAREGLGGLGLGHGGSSSRSAMSRTSSSRAVASSVGSTRVAGMVADVSTPPRPAVGTMAP